MSRSRIPALLLLAVAAWHVSVFASVALSRLTYPFEVEALEGLTIDYARTLAAGGNLYAPPSLHFAPNWYPPLQYAVSLPFLWLSGWQLWGARLVSIASTLGAVAIGIRMLRRAGASGAAIFAAIAIVFAYYPVTWYWYDVARVDSLAVFFTVAGLAVLTRDGAQPTPKALTLGAALLAAGMFTKQTTVVVGLAVLAFFAVERDRRRFLRLLGLFAALGAAGWALLLLFYGRDAFIIYWAPRHHFRNIPVGTRRFAEFAWTMLPLVALAVAGARGLAGTPRGRMLRLFLFAFVASAGLGWLTMCKHGGERNSSMPALFTLAFCVGLGYDGIVRDTARRGLALAAGLAAFLVLAFASDPLAWIPTPLDRQEAAEILADMRAQPGPFLAYNASFVSTVMRGDMYPSRDRLYDWAGGQNQESHLRPDPARYPSDFLAAIRERRFATIYTDAGDPQGDYAQSVIAAHYQPVKAWEATLPAEGDAPRWKSALPRVKWVAKDEPAQR